MRNKKTIIILLSALAAVLVIAITAIGIMLIQGNQKKTKYQEAIDMAQKYVNELNYDAAILKYQEAIQIDEENDVAYANLAVLYINMGNLDEAYKVLEIGYQRTASGTLQTLIATYFSVEASQLATEVNDEDKGIENLSVNRTLIGQIASYSCATYASNYGTATLKTDGLKYTLTYGSIDAKFIYYNLDNETVIDSTLNKPFDYVMPVEIKVNDLSLIFNGMTSTITYAQLQEMGLSSLKIRTIDELPYVTFQYSGCEFIIACSENGDILSIDADNTIKPLNRTSSEGNKYILAGTVINAINGEGVSDADIYVRAAGNQSGDVITKTYSRGDGSYQVELDLGNYTVQVVKEGFIEEFFDVTVTDIGSNQADFTVSPALAEGEVRIVLTWGSSPTDLDSYLDGTADTGESVHISYSSKYATAAELDVDERNGYGPETTTIHDLNGVYTFTVKDYTNSYTMGTSGAEVKVYLPGHSQPVIYTIGSHVTDNDWVVFEIDHGEIRTIDQ